MKLSIECEPRTGFVNVSMHKRDGIQNVDDWRKLSSIDDNSVSEIYSYTFSNVLSNNDMRDMIESWNKKLKKNGIVRLSFIDIEAIGNRVLKGEMQIKDLHDVLFGPSYERKYIFKIETIIDILKENNLFINTISNDGTYITVEAKKL